MPTQGPYGKSSEPEQKLYPGFFNISSLAINSLYLYHGAKDAFEHSNEEASGLRLGDRIHLYRPLNPTYHEIRLLQILLAPDENTVASCQLLTCSLNEDPKYIALSYVWGDPSVTEDIGVNGKTISVTRNLSSALQNIRTVTQKAANDLG